MSLDVIRADALPVIDAASRFLVADLWSAEGVGFIAGEPKVGKSWLALDLAVSIASGTPALRRFAVVHPGPVLVLAGEDRLNVIRNRLDGICRAAAVSLVDLPVHVVAAGSIRVDDDNDRAALEDVVASIQPRLLILDPLVRLHRGSENSSTAMADLFGYLRQVQERHRLAVAVVHHLRKGGSGRAGQRLRGTSELHAWAESSLFLSRTSTGGITMTVEHRAAASIDDLALALDDLNGGLSLRVLEPGAEDNEPSLADRVSSILAVATQPMKVAAIRNAARCRTQALCSAIAELIAAGNVEHTSEGYRLRSIQ